MAVCSYSILNDIHFPYESPLYYKALSQIESYQNLQGIILNGDIAEIESASSHPKGPNARNRLIEEIAYLNEKLDEIQKRFPDVPIAYICGNHEHRIFRFLRDQASVLFGYLDMPVLLKLTERKNFRFFEYAPDQLVKVGKCRDLYARHEPLAGGQMHAKGTAEKAVVSIIYGHTHVYQSYTHKKFGPSPYSVTAISNGFLGDITKPIFEYRGCKDNWQEGHMKINCDDVTGEYECHFQALYRPRTDILVSL